MASPSPRKEKRYHQRKGVEAGAQLRSNREGFDKRPNCVDLKEEVGHWEGYSVHGQDGYPVMLTERVSKLLLTPKLKIRPKK